MESQSIFQTERLIIRNLVSSDLADFHDLQGNPKVAKFTNGHAQNLEEAKADLGFVVNKYASPDNDFWVWAIERKADAEFIGTCAIIKNDSQEWEIGYKVREKFWGNGYASEVAKALMIHCEHQMGLSEIFGYVDKTNLPSINILEKLSMKFIKEFWNEETKTQDFKYVYKA